MLRSLGCRAQGIGFRLFFLRRAQVESGFLLMSTILKVLVLKVAHLLRILLTKHLV